MADFCTAALNGSFQEATLTVTVHGTIQGEGFDTGPENVAAFSLPDADVVPMHALSADDDQSAQDHQPADGLQEAVVLDDGDGDITLPYGDDDASVDGGSAGAPAGSVETASADDGVATDDPTAHLVPDPLAQDDHLHPAHVI